MSYSHRNGFAYRQEFKYNKLFHDGKLLHIVPQIGYNFTKKELYAMLDGEFVYNPLKNGSFGISVGNGNRIYSSIVLDQLKERNDTALFSFENLNLDYFKDVYLNLSHNIEVVNGLKLWTGISMHWRHVAENNPDVASRVRLKYNSFAPRIRVEWTPNMYYYINGNRKVNVGSYYPTFIFDYERGFKLMKNSGEYERFEFSAEQKIRIRNLHTIAYHIGGGFFTNQQDMYFVDYVNFANRNLPEGWNDDIGGTFQMLDGRCTMPRAIISEGTSLTRLPSCCSIPYRNCCRSYRKNGFTPVSCLCHICIRTLNSDTESVPMYSIAEHSSETRTASLLP